VDRCARAGRLDGVGGDAFNKKLSAPRRVDQAIPPESLLAVRGGKSKPKNPSDLNAPENRRVEVVNVAPQDQATK
jgi:hypothetical protein